MTASTGTGPARDAGYLPLTGADCFVLALNRLMRKNGQQELTGQTHILLEGEPDVAALQAAANRLAADYPILDAVASRNPLTLLPGWRWKKQPHSLPVRKWHEAGHAGMGESSGIGSFHGWCEEVMNTPLPLNGGLRNLRLDLVYLKSGGAALVLTWSHLLFDGRGAELLVGHLTNGIARRPMDSKNPPGIPDKIRERIQGACPVVERFFRLSTNKYHSLSGPGAKPGRLHYELLQLDGNQTRLAQERAARLANPLFNTAFYLACAARAHRRAFQSRGGDPDDYVMSVPVQLRRPGTGGALFRNCVSMLFFHLRREDLETLESATRAAQAQFEEMTRRKLDRSFLNVLELMKRIPSPLYMRFVAGQFQGEITSFFHSFTGEFSVPLGEAFGAHVVDAYHIPSVSAPPGTGIFIGMFQGRLTATLSWRDCAATPRECAILRDQLREDLTGGTGN